MRRLLRVGTHLYYVMCSFSATSALVRNAASGSSGKGTLDHLSCTLALFALLPAHSDRPHVGSGSPLLRTYQWAPCTLEVIGFAQGDYDHHDYIAGTREVFDCAQASGHTFSVNVFGFSALPFQVAHQLSNAFTAN